MADDTRPGPKPKVSDQELLSIIRESDDPVVTATEIAEQIEIGRRSTYDRLVKLEERGEVRSKKVGGRTTVWWAPGHTATNPR